MAEQATAKECEAAEDGGPVEVEPPSPTVAARAMRRAKAKGAQLERLRKWREKESEWLRLQYISPMSDYANKPHPLRGLRKPKLPPRKRPKVAMPAEAGAVEVEGGPPTIASRRKADAAPKPKRRTTTSHKEANTAESDKAETRKRNSQKRKPAAAATQQLSNAAKEHMRKCKERRDNPKWVKDENDRWVHRDTGEVWKPFTKLSNIILSDRTPPRKHRTEEQKKADREAEQWKGRGPVIIWDRSEWPGRIRSVKKFGYYDLFEERSADSSDPDI